jgi:hypothetical protein
VFIRPSSQKFRYLWCNCGYDSYHGELMSSSYVGHIERGDDVNLTKLILHAELGHEVRSVGKPEQSRRSCLKNDMNEFEISRSRWNSDYLDRNAWRAKLHVGKKSAMKQWLLREESKHIARHDASNDRNFTSAIFDEVRFKRAERLLQEWTRSNRSRNLT